MTDDWEIVLDQAPAAVAEAMTNFARGRLDAALTELRRSPYAEPPSRPYHVDGPVNERALAVGLDMFVAYWVDEKSRTVVVASIVWVE